MGSQRSGWSRVATGVLGVAALLLPGAPVGAAGAAAASEGVQHAARWMSGLAGATSTRERASHLAADVTFISAGGAVTVGRSEYLRREDASGSRVLVAWPLYLDANGAAVLTSLGGQDVLVVLDIGPSGVQRRTDLLRLGAGPGRTYGSPARGRGGWPEQLWTVHDRAACPGGVLDVSTLDVAGHVTARREMHLAATRCGGAPAAGWWTARPLPEPLGTRVTGRVATSRGTIEIRNGSPELEGAVRSEVRRFERAGLGAPRTPRVTFDPYDPRCGSWAGWFDIASRTVLVCGDADTVCASSDCWGFERLRGVLRHELAHAWVQEHADAPTRAALLETVGLDRWNDPRDHHDMRGIEWAADVVAWGVAGAPDPALPTLLHPDRSLLLAAFGVLTGR